MEREMKKGESTKAKGKKKETVKAVSGGEERKSGGDVTHGCHSSLTA